MSSFYLGNINIAIFGESHNPIMGVTIDGLKAGIKIDESKIKEALSKRRPKDIDTPRKEQDRFEIVSGVFNGYTTSTPLTILLYNEDVQSASYHPNLLRPGQSDMTMMLKTKGFNDYRGGGHNSGRITALIVIVGAIINSILEKKGIKIGTHIKNLYGIIDRDFVDYANDIEYLKNANFASLSKAEEMRNAIMNIREQKNSIGGILETAIIGVQDYLGEGFFDKVESKIGALALSIPGVKGIEFGLGFEFAKKCGSEVVDDIKYVNGTLKTLKNNNGGINGGITNGMPIVFRTVMKPTPTIGKPVNTVNTETRENITMTFSGRHDPCIVSRSSVIMDSVAAIAIFDLYLEKYGYNWME